jgi:hypothetical protein
MKYLNKVSNVLFCILKIPLYLLPCICMFEPELTKMVLLLFFSFLKENRHSVEMNCIVLINTRGGVACSGSCVSVITMLKLEILNIELVVVHMCFLFRADFSWLVYCLAWCYIRQGI